MSNTVLAFHLLHAAENQLHCDLKMLYLFLRENIAFQPTDNKWTKTTDIFSKKYLVIPVCGGHHWILDSLNQKQSSVERRIVRYLRDQ